MNKKLIKTSEEKKIFSDSPSEFRIGIPFFNLKVPININRLLDIILKKMVGKKLTKVENIEIKKFWILLSFVLTMSSFLAIMIAFFVINKWFL